MPIDGEQINEVDQNLTLENEMSTNWIKEFDEEFCCEIGDTDDIRESVTPIALKKWILKRFVFKQDLLEALERESFKNPGNHGDLSDYNLEDIEKGINDSLSHLKKTLKLEREDL